MPEFFSDEKYDIVKGIYNSKYCTSIFFYKSHCVANNGPFKNLGSIQNFFNFLYKDVKINYQNLFCSCSNQSWYRIIRNDIWILRSKKISPIYFLNFLNGLPLKKYGTHNNTKSNHRLTLNMQLHRRLSKIYMKELFFKKYI